MKKFLISEEEKNRILNLHKKFILEQQRSPYEFHTFNPVTSPYQTASDLNQMFAREKEGEMSQWVFDRYKIGDYSEDPASTESPESAESPESTGGKSGFQETNLTIDELKSGKTVSKGMRGPIVKEIQELLIDAGYKDVSKSGQPDSMFGSLTKQQVEKFQSENNDDKGVKLVEDGIVGQKTINALLKLSSEEMAKAAQGETPTELRLAPKEFGKI
jgi:murein L,D-transpeptidase YcbB/YkuD